jgi:hypothetical protein
VTEYTLLKEFRGLFAGVKYEHRRSNLGDFVAMHLYEDLVAIHKSDRYVLSVESMCRTSAKGLRQDAGTAHSAS